MCIENRFSIFFIISHNHYIDDDDYYYITTITSFNVVFLFVWFLYSYHTNTYIQSINRIKRELANLIVVITPWEMRIKKIESKSIKNKQGRKKERIFFDQKKRQRCMLCMFFFVNIKKYQYYHYHYRI